MNLAVALSMGDADEADAPGAPRRGNDTAALS